MVRITPKDPLATEATAGDVNKVARLVSTGTEL